MKRLKQTLNDYALFGGSPILEQLLPFGQLYLPSWEKYKKEMKSIFTRQYYTNQGPLAQELEVRLSEFFGVKHVICVSNESVGLMMAVKSMELNGKVVVPSFSFVAGAQSIKWAGLEPVFCDVNIDTHHINSKTLEAAIERDVTAILAVNLWGGTCNPTEIEHFAAAHNLRLYFDSSHAFGCTVSSESRVGQFGDMEIFSFHKSQILNAIEGACITTNEDDLAARLRNIRSSYGAGRRVEIPLTSNGRMSEAQAALALMSLEEFQQHVGQNKQQFSKYQHTVDRIPGLQILEPRDVRDSNNQYVVCNILVEEFGLTRDQLYEILQAENIHVERYFYPGVHCMPPFHTSGKVQESLSNTDRLCERLIQFPIGSSVTDEIITNIGELLSEVRKDADQINRNWVK